MKKIFSSISILVFATCFFNGYAQQPQIIWQPPATHQGLIPGSAPLSYPEGSRIQSMYKPVELPGLMAGSITAVYLQASVNRPNAITFRNMTVKMCHLPVNESGPNPDTIPWSVFPRVFFPCNTVFYTPLFVPTTPIDSGNWIKFTLQTPFQYNGTGNLLVEFSQDSGSTGIHTLPYLFTVSYKQILRSYVSIASPPYNSNWNPPGNPAYINLIGLDMAPNSVGSVSGLKDMQLYPNPASDKVTLQWDAGKSVKELSVMLTNVTGAVVWQHTYANAGTRFSESIDVSRLPPGLYLAEIKADGEKITRKLVLQ
ncbi:MAG TPA: T9SS type A sorting domain-containing protein [Flavipsychrobacter sp.]|nr:T9SS type A sorting domain-containing protein [Flavipsychrobacter sp.]